MAISINDRQLITQFITNTQNLNVNLPTNEMCIRDRNRPAHQRDTYQAAYHAGRTGNGFRCKPLDRCEHREGQIGIAAVVH